MSITRRFKKRLTPFFYITVLGLIATNAQAFTHPGLLHTASDFARMTSRVNSKTEPQISGWNLLLANSHSSSAYIMQGPLPIVYRGADGTHPENYSKLFNDIAAAYQNALRWKIAGTTANADKAVQILNAWAATLTGISGTSDKYLAAGIYGYEIANVAEILRSYSGWSASSQSAFKNMMKTVFYPMNHSFLVNHNGACISHYWANWDMCNMASILAIGILCDDQAKFTEAISYYYNGAGNGSANHSVVATYGDGAETLGQSQESGRDQGHATLNIALIGPFCQMAYNQGIDAFGYNNNRMLALAEYIAKYNLGDAVPYTPYTNCDNVNQTVISATGRGNLRPCWELFYAHYLKIKKLPAAYTQQYVALVRPEGGGGDYGPNSGGFDSLGFGTLTFAQ